MVPGSASGGVRSIRIDIPLFAIVLSSQATATTVLFSFGHSHTQARAEMNATSAFACYGVYPQYAFAHTIVGPIWLHVISPTVLDMNLLMLITPLEKGLSNGY